MQNARWFKRRHTRTRAYKTPRSQSRTGSFASGSEYRGRPRLRVDRRLLRRGARIHELLGRGPGPPCRGDPDGAAHRAVVRPLLVVGAAAGLVLGILRVAARALALAASLVGRVARATRSVPRPLEDTHAPVPPLVHTGSWPAPRGSPGPPSRPLSVRLGGSRGFHRWTGTNSPQSRADDSGITPCPRENGRPADRAGPSEPRAQLRPSGSSIVTFVCRVVSSG